MILKRNYNDESKEISSWIDGAFDAISKKYVDKICLSIHSQIDNELLEAYTFEILYDENNGNSSTPQISLNNNKMIINDAKSLKKNIDRFYRMIQITLQPFNSIPDDKKPTTQMRIIYNKNAPLDYEPDNFQNKINDSEEFQFLFKKPPKIMSIGTVATPHHSASLQVKSIDRFYVDEQDSVSDQDGDSDIYDPFQMNQNVEQEPNVIDATSSLTISSKKNRPKQLKIKLMLIHIQQILIHQIQIQPIIQKIT